MFGELKSWFQQLVADKKVETDEAAFVGEQAKFLLTQAALVQVNPGETDATRLAAIGAAYGYMNPLTFYAIAGNNVMDHGDGLFYTLPTKNTGRITIWILTTLLPEGTLIAGPNLMPGIELLVAKQVAAEKAVSCA